MTKFVANLIWNGEFVYDSNSIWPWYDPYLIARLQAEGAKGPWEEHHLSWECSPLSLSWERPVREQHWIGGSLRRGRRAQLLLRPDLPGRSLQSIHWTSLAGFAQWQLHLSAWWGPSIILHRYYFFVFLSVDGLDGDLEFQVDRSWHRKRLKPSPASILRTRRQANQDQGGGRRPPQEHAGHRRGAGLQGAMGGSVKCQPDPAADAGRHQIVDEGAYNVQLMDNPCFHSFLRKLASLGMNLIIWTFQNVNHSNSALTPFPELPNAPKVT